MSTRSFKNNDYFLAEIPFKKNLVPSRFLYPTWS